MPRKQAAHEVARNQTAIARAQCRAAYEAAKGAGGLASSMADRIWSDTLLAAEHQGAGTAREMFTRTSDLLSLLSDRQSWPR